MVHRVGSELKRRFELLGVRPCNRCMAIAAEMDEKGADWCEDNIEQLVRRIDINVTRHKQVRVKLAAVVPRELRQRWIKRAIRKAINTARKNG